MTERADITGLTISLLNSEGRIDQALDKGDRRAFRVWCTRRSSLAARLQHALLTLLTAIPA